MMKKTWLSALLVFIVVAAGVAFFVISQSDPVVEQVVIDDAIVDDNRMDVPDDTIEVEEGVIDLSLPSESIEEGALAVRLYVPKNPRYEEGAPVIVWVPGGYEEKGIDHGFPPTVNDIIIVTFIFPGATDEWSGLSSEGVYDWRGDNCIRALADVIKFAAGKLEDEHGNTIDDLSPVPVLHENIGAIGVSNGGNLPVAAAAFYGSEFDENLRYIIQWETPVSSQIANRDFGRVWVKEGGPLNDYYNLRYAGYGDTELAVSYDDLTYDPDQEWHPVFHDGNGDGVYTTGDYFGTSVQGPDANIDGVLSLDEDFPLDGYQGGEDGELWFFSRPVTRAMESNDIFADYGWPEDIATVEQSEEYWNLRESVYLYDDAMANIPDLEAMILAGEVDHVQTNPEKPHLRMAFEGWLTNDVSWVMINPSKSFITEVYPGYNHRQDLPKSTANKPPQDWSDAESYTFPEDIETAVYQLAGVYQMMDRAQK